MKVSDYAGVKAGLTGLSGRIETGRAATSADERRKNVDTIKGLVGKYFVEDANVSSEIYSNHTTIDIEGVIRRSEIELANYELKQGLLLLVEGGKEDPDMAAKVVRTISAIANIGPKSTGKILIGVTDKNADATRVKNIDGIDAKKVGKRFIVGVCREAKRLGIATEAYFSRWKDIIRKSDLTPAARDSVLSSMDFNSFYGLGVIVITIPPQKELTYVGDQLYWRNGDSTEAAVNAKQIAGLAARFV